ncbi:glycosyltransferase [Candidatus Fermentibacteria bacterium]|nr:glycosyltransferase [Candidatus Fermentibacteria bacterium]
MIIPARNEEKRIGRLLDSLDRQTVRPHEVIVVDDQSSDRTEAVARERGASVITGGPLPGDWYGKPWACWQGACASKGDLLLFMDADTWLEPDGLGRLFEMHEGSGLLSVQPYHETEKFLEQFSAFPNLVSLAAVGAFTPLGDRLRPGGAFGPCLMCSREEYFRIGGHAAVRAEILEDVRLAGLFQHHRLAVRCRTGRGIVSFRMYPEGLKQVFSGWTRGIGFGAFSVNPLFSILVSAWITGCFSAFFALAGALSAPANTSHTLACFASYCSYVLSLVLMLKGAGRFGWWVAPFYPLPLFFFGALTACSLVRSYVIRRIEWKGREILTSRRRE